jgi:hypothetical protein
MTRCRNISVVLVLVLCLLVQAPLVFAGDAYEGESMREAKRSVSGEEMVADLVFARPAGFVGLVLGAAAFVVALPFTLPTQQVEEAGKKLVVAPAKFTFARPLGYK